MAPKPVPAEPETAAAEEARVYQVGELTREIRVALEGRFGLVWVEGEVSNHRQQSSGHHYFSLKDDTSQIACVLFRGAASGIAGISALREGALIRVCGELTVYEARGQVQLIVRDLRPHGAGQWQARFEALKEKLRSEGLFESARKQPIPRFPRTIGVVTSPTGAAFQDFMKVLAARFPVEVVLAPVRVQGVGAAAEIAAAIRRLTLVPAGESPVEVIVLARGGGSIEDLWEFNEEAVARAIVACPIPIVTGIGHEIDFTIADFAADLRAPTPSAAAAAVAPDRRELNYRIQQAEMALRRRLRDTLTAARNRLESLSLAGIFHEPARRIRGLRQDVDRREDDLRVRAETRLQRHRQRVLHAAAVVRAHAPLRQSESLRRRVSDLSTAMLGHLLREIEARRRMLSRHAALLEAFNPRRVLDRGYTITRTPEGRVLRHAGEVAPGDALISVFPDGEVASRVAPRGDEG